MLLCNYGIIEDAKFIKLDSVIGATHTRYYSDENKYILQVETNIEYSEAIDIMPIKYTYVEIDKIIEQNWSNYGDERQSK